MLFISHLSSDTMCRWFNVFTSNDIELTVNTDDNVLTLDQLHKWVARKSVSNTKTAHCNSIHEHHCTFHLHSGTLSTTGTEQT